MIYRPPEQTPLGPGASANRDIVVALLAMAFLVAGLIWYTDDWWCRYAPWLCVPDRRAGVDGTPAAGTPPAPAPPSGALPDRLPPAPAGGGKPGAGSTGAPISGKFPGAAALPTAGLPSFPTAPPFDAGLLDWVPEPTPPAHPTSGEASPDSVSIDAGPTDAVPTVMRPAAGFTLDRPFAGSTRTPTATSTPEAYPGAAGDDSGAPRGANP